MLLQPVYICKPSKHFNNFQPTALLIYYIFTYQILSRELHFQYIVIFDTLVMTLEAQKYRCPLK